MTDYRLQAEIAERVVETLLAMEGRPVGYSNVILTDRCKLTAAVAAAVRDMDLRVRRV